MFLFYVVLQPNITGVTIAPSANNDGQLLHQFNETVSLTCTAEGGPRIMTRWQFDNGSTVANGTSSVTYQVPSLSSEHTGVYYCEAIIDSMMDTSLSYTLFGEYVFRSCFQCLSVCLSVIYIIEKLYGTTVQWYTKFSKFCYTTIVSHFEHILPCHHMVAEISVVVSVFVQLL